jgi:hypothetical protein
LHGGQGAEAAAHHGDLVHIEMTPIPMLVGAIVYRLSGLTSPP